MLKLCGFHISNYFCKARIAMLEKGLDFELDPSCRPSQAPEFLARTPMGKVPFLELDGATLSESQVICEYLEDAYPEKPLYPRDPLERARVRELITYMELHIELVARRLYPQAPNHKLGSLVDFHGLPRQGRAHRAMADAEMAAQLLLQIRGDLRARFRLEHADCAAYVHLPLVSLATKLAYGEDVFTAMPQVKPYIAMLGERPAFRRVTEDRKAAQAAMKK